VSRPSIEGDVLLLDYHAVDENDRPIPKRSVKGYVLELGAGRVVADFETAVRGAEPGALREAHVPYPEDYSDKFLAGRTVRYKIKVLKVSEKRFPVLTDELVAATTNFKTIEELRMKIRADLEERAERVGVDRLERSLLEKVVDANSFEPPASLVEGLLEDVVAQLKFEAESRGQDPSSIDPEAIRSANRSGAAREIRRSLVLDGIARAEHIRVSSQEIESAVALMAKRRGLPAKKLLSQMGGDRFIRRLSRQLRDKKTLAFLARNAEISQKIVSGNREEAAEKASP
jgi:trigger factor